MDRVSSGSAHPAARVGFALVASTFVFTALFHIAVIARPSIAAASPASPAWRHGLFAVINVFVAVGLLQRPRGFTLAFAVLCAQQLYSHGPDFWNAWHDQGRVDWLSLAVLVVMPATLVALVRVPESR